MNEREIVHWKLIKAKMEVDLSQYESAKTSSLQILQSSCLAPKERIKAQFLLAVSLESLEETEAFCTEGEKALELLEGFEAQMRGISPSSMHSSLYNAYIELSKEKPLFIERAKEHLYQAFEKHASLSSESLLWLGSSMVEEKDPRGARVLEHLSFERDFLTKREKEEVTLNLAKSYLQQSQSEKAISLLESLEKNADAPTSTQKEIFLLLAKEYQKQGSAKKALKIYEKMAPEKGLVKSELDATFLLEMLKLKKALLKNSLKKSPDSEYVLVGLKNLVLQKKLIHEPLYFEASLEYLDLKEREGISLEKKKALIEKMKKDFLSEEGVLARDYHEERRKNPEKNQLFQSFLTFLDAKLFEIEGRCSESEKLQSQLSEISFLRERIQSLSWE